MTTATPLISPDQVRIAALLAEHQMDEALQALRQRIAELEKQNRELLATIRRMEEKL